MQVILDRPHYRSIASLLEKSSEGVTWVVPEATGSCSSSPTIQDGLIVGSSVERLVAYLTENEAHRETFWRLVNNLTTDRHPPSTARSTTSSAGFQTQSTPANKRKRSKTDGSTAVSKRHAQNSTGAAREELGETTVRLEVGSEGSSVPRENEADIEILQDVENEGDGIEDTTGPTQGTGLVNVPEYAGMTTWFRQRPGCSGLNPTMYKALILKGLNVGCLQAFMDWKSVLSYWRAKGTLVTTHHPDSELLSIAAWAPSLMLEGVDGIPPHLTPEFKEASDLPEALDNFVNAFDVTGGVQAKSILDGTLDRHSLAHLYWCYRDVERVVVTKRRMQQSQERLTSDEKEIAKLKAQTIAKRVIYVRLYTKNNPSTALSIAEDPSKLNLDKKNLRHLTKRLEKGQRWYELGRRFGRSVFAFMPIEKVPNSFVERIKMDQFHAWLGFIEEFNPIVKPMCKAFGHVVLRALLGAPPPEQVFPLEEVPEDILETMHTSQLLNLLVPRD